VTGKQHYRSPVAMVPQLCWLISAASWVVE